MRNENKGRLVVVWFEGSDNTDWLEAIPASAVSVTRLVDRREIVDLGEALKIAGIAMAQIVKGVQMRRRNWGQRI